MEWLSQNWFWVVVFVLFFGMHLFGHGGHGGRGGHGGHGGCGGSSDESRRPSDKDKQDKDRSQGHQH